MNRSFARYPRYKFLEIIKNEYLRLFFIVFILLNFYKYLENGELLFNNFPFNSAACLEVVLLDSINYGI